MTFIAALLANDERDPPCHRRARCFRFWLCWQSRPPRCRAVGAVAPKVRVARVAPRRQGARRAEGFPAAVVDRAAMEARRAPAEVAEDEAEL